MATTTTDTTAASARRVAIVTGGTRGIGAGIASALADDDYDLLLTYNSNVEAAEEFKCQILQKHAHLQCELVGGDLSKAETRDLIFDCFDQKFGTSKTLCVVVHNAGQYVGITSANDDNLEATSVRFGNNSILDKETGKPKFEHMQFYQNLYGTAFIDLCERGIARMKENIGGSLIGISSPGCNLSYRANADYSLPGSGKCVMEFSMRIIASMAAPKNINCNVLVPGVTLTQAWDRLADFRGLPGSESFTNSIVERMVPMKRAIAPRGIGNVAAFLCSDNGRYITGVSLPVDGGLHLK